MRRVHEERPHLVAGQPVVLDQAVVAVHVVETVATVDDSIAAKVGLRKGDIVIRVGEKKIHTVADVAEPSV